MKKTTCYYLFYLLLISSAVSAQTKDNTELQKMYDEDQGARKVPDINWSVLIKQDSIRQARVFEMIREGKIVTGKDYYNSAMIFQHGNDTLASGMAVKQMKKAIELDSTVNRWLLAAAIDRDLMRRDLPQIYGTQFIKMRQDARWELYKIDSTQITDEQRKYYRTGTLAEQRERVRTMNLVTLWDQYSKSNSIGETIALIKKEKPKGKQSVYDVSESGINSFGYSLMTGGKDDEALKIFQLNTQLYPEAYNTFDSYGECLMKLGRKEEALKAYRKSLELNPQNEGAKRVLEMNK
jgi:tetratricopeptide (TPR) repeat protein